MYVKNHDDPTSHGISSNSNWLLPKSSDLKRDMRVKYLKLSDDLDF